MENKSSTCHMTSEQRLIDANEALRMIVDSKVDNPFALIRGQGEIWKKAHDCAIDCVKNAPTVDAVQVSDKELLKAIKLLIKQYEHSKNSDYVHHPVAHAFFKTWRQLDKRR